MNGFRWIERTRVIAVIVIARAMLCGSDAYPQGGNLVFRTTRMSQVTGGEDRSIPGMLTGAQLTGVTGGVSGTDLGFPFEHNNRLYFLFGDVSERSKGTGRGRN